VPSPDPTPQQLAGLIVPLCQDEGGAIVCDFGGRIDHPDGGYSYVDGPRFRVRPGETIHGINFEDLKRRIAERAVRDRAWISGTRARPQ